MTVKSKNKSAGSLAIPKIPKIPVAATSIAAMQTLGEVYRIPRYSLDNAVILNPSRKMPDGLSVWCRASYDGYRNAFRAAFERFRFHPDSSGKLMDDMCLDAFYDQSDPIDIDHVYARSWALKGGHSHWYLRMYPVLSNVNQEAGRSREKRFDCAYRNGTEPAHGIVWILPYQLLKILHHPIGDSKNGYHENLF